MFGTKAPMRLVEVVPVRAMRQQPPHHPTVILVVAHNLYQYPLIWI